MKYIYLLVGIGLLAFITAACSDDSAGQALPPIGKADIPVRLSLPGSREGVSLLESGTKEERRITHVRILTFSGLTGVWEQSETFSKGSAGWPTDENGSLDFSYFTRSGSKQILVVANETPALAAWLDDTDGLNVSRVLRRLSDAATTLPAIPADLASWRGFLMTGRTNVNIAANHSAAAPFPVSVAIDRAVARIDLRVDKAGMVSGIPVQLTRVTLVRGANRALLFPATSGTPAPAGVERLLQGFTTSFNPSNGVLPDPIISDATADVSTFYAYENLAAQDTTLATCLDIEARIDEGPKQFTRTARIYLGRSGTEGSYTYNLLRNTLYRLHITISSILLDQLLIQTQVLPWNVENTLTEAGIQLLTQPTDITGNEQTPVILTVSVKSQYNTPCSYTWFIDGKQKAITQSGTYSLAVTPEMDGKTYHCKIEDGLGNLIYTPLRMISYLH